MRRMKRFGCIALILLSAGAALFANNGDEEHGDENSYERYQEPVVKTPPSYHDDYMNFFIAGLRAGVISPFEGGARYAGGGLRVNIISIGQTGWKSSTLSPALYDIFLEINLYKNVIRSASSEYMFNYLFGINASFDRSYSLRRFWLIPYYGVKLGGIYLNDDAQTKNGFALFPFVGISLIRTRSLYLNAEVSILLSSVDFKRLVSWEPTLSFGFSF